MVTLPAERCWPVWRWPAYAVFCLKKKNDLVEAGESHCELDARYGRRIAQALPTINEADSLLEQAIDAVRGLGVRWEGQVLEVEGDPIIAGGITSDSEKDE